MMSARCRFAQTLWVAAAVLFASQAAFAVNYATYTDQFGSNFSFTNITEQSDCDPTDVPACTDPWGDTEPLFGQPAAVGDSLLFTPTGFLAQSGFGGGNDLTGSQLNVAITATALSAVIDTVLIDDLGDMTLTPGLGGQLSAVYAAMSGYIVVTHTTSGAITPVIIGFNAGGGVNGSFSIPSLGTPYAVNSMTYPGTTLWSGNILVNVASLVPNATRVEVVLDNDLQAASEAGAYAKIQKKVTISVIPEPGTFALVCGGLLALSLRGRSRRS